MRPPAVLGSEGRNNTSAASKPPAASLRLAIDAREAWDGAASRLEPNRLAPRTGIGRYLANLLAGLEQHGGIIDGRSIEPILLGPAPLFDLGGGATAAERHGAQVFYSPYYKIPFGLKLPALATVHDLIPLGFPPPARWIFRARLAHALSCADRIVTVSETSRTKILAMGVAPERIVLAPNCVAPGLTPRPSPDDAAVLSRHALSSKRFVLAAIDRRPYKNLAGLLRAWERVRTDLPLVVTTEPSDPQDPRVRFLGRVGEAEMRTLYRHATLVVHPSFDEGFGLPVLEAMASGTPVAAARAGAVPEVGGDAVAYFDPADFEEIARVVSDLLADGPRRETLRSAALARAALASPANRTLPFWRAVVALHAKR